MLAQKRRHLRETCPCAGEAASGLVGGVRRCLAFPRVCSTKNPGMPCKRAYPEYVSCFRNGF